jgi:hypothetical protein
LMLMWIDILRLRSSRKSKVLPDAAGIDDGVQPQVEAAGQGLADARVLDGQSCRPKPSAVFGDLLAVGPAKQQLARPLEVRKMP